MRYIQREKIFREKIYIEKKHSCRTKKYRKMTYLDWKYCNNAVI